MMRCVSSPPSTGTTAWCRRPAPMMATQGGTTTGVAYLPAKTPKFDSMMV